MNTYTAVIYAVCMVTLAAGCTTRLPGKPTGYVYMSNNSTQGALVWTQDQKEPEPAKRTRYVEEAQPDGSVTVKEVPLGLGQIDNDNHLIRNIWRYVGIAGTALAVDYLEDEDFDLGGLLGGNDRTTINLDVPATPSATRSQIDGAEGTTIVIRDVSQSAPLPDIRNVEDSNITIDFARE